MPPLYFAVKAGFFAFFLCFVVLLAVLEEAVCGVVVGKMFGSLGSVL